MNPDRSADAFRRYACEKLADHLAQIARCVNLLSVDQAWHRPNERSNSVANLLLHLRGNITQWIVSGLGGQPFDRDRPAEFARRERAPTQPLLQNLQAVVADACDVIRGLSDTRIAEPVTIQGYETTVLAAVFHVVEHFSFHTGQIVWATKAILDVNLSLYDAQGHRLDRRAGATP